MVGVQSCVVIEVASGGAALEVMQGIRRLMHLWAFFTCVCALSAAGCSRRSQGCKMACRRV